ncbi:MAG TPA: hypothetical protein VFP35_00865 [Candidatus Saccharimonadales bacterium]|nr:hypothetical protein [Candidatus Saccharimonadales bacterium]
MTAQAKLHVETFRVYSDDVLAEPTVRRGAAVVSFWNNGMPARFLDFLMDPDQTDAASTYKGNLAYQLDEADPPEVSDGRVYEMGLEAGYFGGNRSTSYFFPNKVYSVEGRQMGQFALACLKNDSVQSSAGRRAANIVRLGTASEVQTLASPFRGSSLLFMHEHSPVVIADGGEGKAFADTKYQLIYDRRAGLRVEPYEGWPGDDFGGSDREPRQPINPQTSGAIEVELSEEAEFRAYPAPTIETEPSRL